MDVESSAMPGALRAVVPYRARCWLPLLPGRGQPQPWLGLSIPSDMSEAQWAVREPLLPHPAWLADKGGRPAGFT